MITLTQTAKMALLLSINESTISNMVQEAKDAEPGSEVYKNIVDFVDTASLFSKTANEMVLILNSEHREEEAQLIQGEYDKLTSTIQEMARILKIQK